MNLFKIFLFIIILGLSFGCSNCKVYDSRVNSEKPVLKNTIKNAAIEKFGKNAKIVFNKDKKFAIVIGNNIIDKNHQLEKTPFFVYDILNKKIIFEDNVVESKIFWEDKFVVRTARLPGIISKNNEENKFVGGYSFNVLTLKKSFK